MLSIIKATAVAFAGLALVPALARAHTVADPDGGTAGGTLRAAFRITHGCNGSPATAVTSRLLLGAKAGCTGFKGVDIFVDARNLTNNMDVSNAVHAGAQAKF
jgi:hypothetical protein